MHRSPGLLAAALVTLSAPSFAQSPTAVRAQSSTTDPWSPIDQLERQGNHEAAARAYLALLAPDSRVALDGAALERRAEHIVSVVRASRSDRDGFELCEQIASRIELRSDPASLRVALSLRLRCAESELSTLAERRRAAGPVGPDLYAIEREARSLAERLAQLQTDARSLPRSSVETVLATALVGRANGLLGDESSALRSASEAARAWAEMVDVPALVVALSSGDDRRRAERARVPDAPELVGSAPGPSARERSLRASVGDSLVDRTWTAVVELVWVAIERDRRAVTSLRIEPLARSANELRSERWFSAAAGPVLDRHRALLEPAMLARYEALWSADATSARFAAALRVGELFLDYAERNRAVQDTLIARSPMPEVLRGYVSPSDEAYARQARAVFERCVAEAQRAGVDNQWTRACAQRLRAVGDRTGVVVDELVPSVHEARTR